MYTRETGVTIARLIGYGAMILSAYKIGGLWYSIFVFGVIAWMPSKWSSE